MAEKMTDLPVLLLDSLAIVAYNQTAMGDHPGDERTE